MSCERRRPMLMDVAAGAPAPTDLTAHLVDCGACRADLDQGQQLLGRIDAEVEAALHVQPSVHFLPRVRQRVAEPPLAARRWLMAWLVPAGIGVLLVSRILIHNPAAPVPALERAAATEPRPLPGPRLSPVPSSPPATRPVGVRVARPERVSAAMPAVLIPGGEREALRRYMRDLQSRRVDSTLLRMVDVEASGLGSIDMRPIDLAPIRIARIGVQPLTMESY